MARVYISTTSEMLDGPEGEAARRAIRGMGHLPCDMKLYTASSRPTLAKLEAHVRECDGIVLLVGDRYGAIPHEFEHEPAPRSFMHFEYEVSQREPALPLWPCLRRLRAPAGAESAATTDAGRFAAFRRRIEERHSPFLFDTATELELEVQRCVAQIPPTGEDRGRLLRRLDRVPQVNDFEGYVKTRVSAGGSAVVLVRGAEGQAHDVLVERFCDELPGVLHRAGHRGLADVGVERLPPLKIVADGPDDDCVRDAEAQVRRHLGVPDDESLGAAFRRLRRPVVVGARFPVEPWTTACRAAAERLAGWWAGLWGGASAESGACAVLVLWFAHPSPGGGLLARILRPASRSRAIAAETDAVGGALERLDRARRLRELTDVSPGDAEDWARLRDVATHVDPARRDGWIARAFPGGRPRPLRQVLHDLTEHWPEPRRTNELRT